MRARILATAFSLAALLGVAAPSVQAQYTGYGAAPYTGTYGYGTYGGLSPSGYNQYGYGGYGAYGYGTAPYGSSYTGYGIYNPYNPYGTAYGTTSSYLVCTNAQTGQMTVVTSGTATTGYTNCRPLGQ